MRMLSRLINENYLQHSWTIHRSTARFDSLSDDDDTTAHATKCNQTFSDFSLALACILKGWLAGWVLTTLSAQVDCILKFTANYIIISFSILKLL